MRFVVVVVCSNSDSRLAQLVERVTSNDEVSRSSRLMGIFFVLVPLSFFRLSLLSRLHSAHHGHRRTAGRPPVFHNLWTLPFTVRCRFSPYRWSNTLSAIHCPS